MSHFYHKSFFILPLLSVLAMPPSEIMAVPVNRGIASLNAGRPRLEQKSPHPLFDSWADKIDSSETKHNKDISLALFQEHLKLTGEKVKAQNNDTLNAQTKTHELFEHSVKLRSLVLEIVQLKSDFQSLQQNELIKNDEEAAAINDLLVNKMAINGLIESFETQLQLNENSLTPLIESELVIAPRLQLLVARKGNSLPAETKEKEVEVKVVEDKAESKDDAKPASVTANAHVCEETKPVLPDQFNQLMLNQNVIMMALLNLTQSMMGLIQQQQTNPYMQNSISSYHYNYPNHIPSVGGNWIFQPHGFQPGAGQQVPFHQPLPSVGGSYPEELNRPSPTGPVPNLQPVMPALPQIRTEPYRMPGLAQDLGMVTPFPGPAMAPATFGNDPYGFNFQS